MTVTRFSKTWTYFDGRWHEGNVPIMGARTHAAWCGTSVFDGARAFEGVMPDLDLHMARVNRSAEAMMLNPVVPPERWVELAKDGVERFGARPELYIRPFYWAEAAGYTSIVPAADSTRWCLTLYETPMAKPTGFSITLSPFRRPMPDAAILEAKAGCLYPNGARALAEAHARGFENCLLCDALGNVAELAIANIFMAKGRTVFTPAANGSFLNGITRQRVIQLLRDAGIEVIETTLRYDDFFGADEIFSTGNLYKVIPINRIDARILEPGPMFRRARELYWEFAHG